jgi:hypothetical protein
MDIKTFVQAVASLPAEISVLAKGPTGIGKSHIFHQVGKNLNLPVVDRRLSQMTEGDIIGLPELIDGVTRFAPVDWLVKACNEPVILFFDELNRATLEVQQCAFQIVLDRELNGNKLHPETRVYAAVNEGSEYQVLDMDPALLRRFWAIDLEPTVDDWLSWASSRDDIPEVVRVFIRNNPNFLRHDTQMEPGKVYPNPASWHRLCSTLMHANINPDSYAGNQNLPELLYPLCQGFIGDATTIKFINFVREYEKRYSAEDVVDRWSEKGSEINELKEDKKNELIEQIMIYIERSEDLDLQQVLNCSLFVKACPDEMVVNFFNLVMETKKINLIRKFHKHLGKLVTEIVNASDNI